jgi:HPt (histidine-containing phosphotransfer) domain-containing protein
MPNESSVSSTGSGLKGESQAMSESLQDVNPAVLQALRELMQDDYALLLDTFQGDADLRLRQLREALQADDMDAFRQAAHSFKGSCGNMGAAALEQACLEAEAAGLAGDSAEAAKALTVIEQAFVRLKPLLH